jgi:hypothetical protein
MLFLSDRDPVPVLLSVDLVTPLKPSLISPTTMYPFCL